MTRTSTGLCLATAFGLAVSLSAQTPTTPQTRTSAMAHDRDSISVTGCLQRDASGGFTLSNAHIDTSATTTTTGTTTGTTGTTGTTTTAGTTTATGKETSGSMSSAGTTWKLEGSSSELDRHVGHKVTVTGHEVSSASSSASTTTTATTTGTTATGTTGTTGTTSITSEEQKRSSPPSQPERRLDVQSVKMISSSCP